MKEPLVLALFVTSENRHRAMANLSVALEVLPSSAYYVFECNVVDMPEILEAIRILATPTLIRYWPRPQTQIIGDLSDIKRTRGVLLSDVGVEPQLIHTLYAKQDVRHEVLADRLRTTEIAKLAKMRICGREKFISFGSSNFDDQSGDNSRRAKA